MFLFTKVEIAIIACVITITGKSLAMQIYNKSENVYLTVFYCHM